MARRHRSARGTDHVEAQLKPILVAMLPWPHASACCRTTRVRIPATLPPHRPRAAMTRQSTRSPDASGCGPGRTRNDQCEAKRGALRATSPAWRRQAPRPAGRRTPSENGGRDRRASTWTSTGIHGRHGAFDRRWPLFASPRKGLVAGRKNPMRWPVARSGRPTINIGTLAPRRNGVCLATPNLGMIRGRKTLPDPTLEPPRIGDGLVSKRTQLASCWLWY
jgi:hypothetical protein